MKTGDKVLIRDDNGQFTVQGVVVERQKHSKTVIVNYNNHQGVFHTSDLQKVKERA